MKAIIISVDSSPTLALYLTDELPSASNERGRV